MSKLTNTPTDAQDWDILFQNISIGLRPTFTLRQPTVLLCKPTHRRCCWVETPIQIANVGVSAQEHRCIPQFVIHLIKIHLIKF